MRHWGFMCALANQGTCRHVWGVLFGGSAISTTNGDMAVRMELMQYLLAASGYPPNDG
jgi:hypothetical protein